MARQTGLPFVFALWALRPAVRNMSAVADAFRARQGPWSREPQCDRLRGKVQDAAFRQRYLGRHIRYDMGGREKQGLALYRELLAKWLLIESADPPLRFV
jgi:predicted solute-binding protein